MPFSMHEMTCKQCGDLAQIGNSCVGPLVRETDSSEGGGMELQGAVWAVTAWLLTLNMAEQGQVKGYG